MKKIILITLLASFSLTNAQVVNSWITTGDESQKLNPQADISFIADDNSGGNIIDIDTGINYQTMDGFGFALTQGSAESLLNLNTSVRLNLLNELYGLSNDAQSVIRISLGASDLSNSVYTYNDTVGDVEMTNFSLSGPDETYLIPVLQEILAINPNVKILATPWTSPIWMKTNNTWIGGRLNPSYYEAYALYFVKYLDAMAALGIDIWAITPQNEPENGNNEPSLLMDADEQLDFINNHLGPAITNAGYSTKIIAFDHNCDNTAYPIQVLNNSAFVDGAAFHLYAGDISAMSTVKNQTGKNVYFTEQFTSSNGNFGDDLSWHLRNVVIGSTRNWSKAVIEWNLSSNADFGPRTPGGCVECLGAVTVTGNATFDRNVSYYIIGHISRFVDPGAVRIETNMTDVHNVAFLNPDNTIALIAFNNGSNPNFKVRVGSKSFSYSLPQGAVASFKWQNNAQTLVDITSPTAGTSFNEPANITIEANATDEDNTITEVAFYQGTTQIGVDTTAPFSFQWNNVTAGNYVLTAEATNDANEITVSEPVSISVTNNSSQLIPNGVYKIFNTVNSEFITVDSNVPHDAFMQTEDETSDFQLWTITYEEESDNVYRIVNNGSNTTLGINDNWCGQFGDVRANFSNTDSNVQFRISEVDEANTYNFQIAFTTCNFDSTNDPIKVFDIENGASGGQIQTFDIDSGNPNQQFQIISNSVLSNNDFDTNNFLNLFYNKETRTLALNANENNTINKVVIFDLNGRIINTGITVSSKKVELDFTGFSNGIYLMKIEIDNKVITKKAIIY